MGNLHNTLYFKRGQTGKVNYATADANCADLGMSLARFETQEEIDGIMSLAGERELGWLRRLNNVF